MTTLSESRPESATHLSLDALGSSGSYRARKPTPILDVSGQQRAELSLVPALYVGRTMNALRKAETLPLEERLDAIARSGQAYQTATIGGCSPDEYRFLVSRVCGLPVSVVGRSMERIARMTQAVFHNVQSGRPQGAVNDWHDPESRVGTAVWTRNGDVFGVHASGNSPGVHSTWLHALALGYRVAVRPSRREPFTPHRLVTALRGAGFADNHVAFLPTDYDAADEIIRSADLSIAYGGDDVMRKYANSGILPRGPGRSKILLTADVDPLRYVDMIVESVASGAGTGCTNATAVLVEGDPAPLASAVAAALADSPALPPEHPDAVLPVQSTHNARRLSDHLTRRAEGATAMLGGDGVAEDLGDGSSALRPAVHILASAQDDRIGLELPFPCVWFAPWTRADGIAPLRHTIVLTAVTTDDPLITELVNEPTIRNVHVGDVPTSWSSPGLPHDGYLTDYLMRAKTVIRTNR
jgi:acyl-CoA reductase-like NAD-dependent aldehyde dehydrogenase